MGLRTSFTKVRLNTHSANSQYCVSSTADKSTLTSQDLPRSLSGMDDQESFGSQKKKYEDDGSIIHCPNSETLSNSGNVNRNLKILSKRWIPNKSSGLFASFTSFTKKSNLSGEHSPSSNHSSSHTSSHTRERRSSITVSVSEYSVGDVSSSVADAGDDDLSNILQEIKDDRDFKETLNESDGEQRSLSSQLSSQLPPVEMRRPKRRPSVVSSEGSFSKELGEENNNDDAKNNEDLDLYVQANTNNNVPLQLDSESMLTNLGDLPPTSVCANKYINDNEGLSNNNETTVESGVPACSSSVLGHQKWESIPLYSKSDLLIRNHLGKGSFSDAFEVSVMVTMEENRAGSSEKEELDKLLKAKFNEDEEDDDLDMQIDAMLAAALTASQEPIHSQPSETPARRQGGARRQSMDQHGISASSFCDVQKKRVGTTYAMKCLRPHIRSNAKLFTNGMEDLIHETAMLASLDHPNIIKLHGRAVSDSHCRLRDGYFILLDRLQDTLEDRIVMWKHVVTKNNSKISKAKLWSSQLETACSIANALSYLHSKNIVFRDLKPANVGFDSYGALKLFDFGFAIEVKEKSSLYDISGTPRYMAPEVGLGRGYSLPVDVHSFGILMWEILSLKKPFGHIKSTSEFSKSVFHGGLRPKLARGWHPCLKDIMSGCWCVEARERLTMKVVAGVLGAHVREISFASQQQNNIGSLRKSSVFRRLTG